MAEGFGRVPFWLESDTLKTKLKVGLVSEVRIVSLDLTFFKIDLLGERGGPCVMDPGL